MADAHPATFNQYSHEHQLVWKTTDAVQFQCDGCLEFGCGGRYQCGEGCNYNLHDVCVMAPNTIPYPFLRSMYSSFFGNYTLEFNTGGVVYTRSCDACGKTVKGYMYQTKNGKYDFHPTCVKLPFKREYDGETLKLERKKLKGMCGLPGCQGNFDGWFYKSRNYKFHVGCVKEMVVADESAGDNVTRLVANSQRRIQPNRGSSSGGNIWLKCVKAFVRFALSVLIGDPMGAIFNLVELLISQ